MSAACKISRILVALVKMDSSAGSFTFTSGSSDVAPTAPHLPAEILCMVFRHVARDHPTLSACACVSKSWLACACKLLYARTLVGDFDPRKGFRPVANSLSQFQHRVEKYPYVPEAVLTLDVAWPCDVAQLARTLTALPNVHRLSLWSMVGGRLDRPLVTLEGIDRRTEGTDIVFAANRALIIMKRRLAPDPPKESAQTDEIFEFRRARRKPDLADPRYGWSATEMLMQRFLDFLALFAEIVTLVVDGGDDYRHNRNFDPRTELRYPKRLKVNLLRYQSHVAQYYGAC